MTLDPKLVKAQVLRRLGFSCLLHHAESVQRGGGHVRMRVRLRFGLVKVRGRGRGAVDGPVAQAV